MAYNVKFLKGTAAEYTSASKNSTTFYYTTDDAQLYLGEIKLSNGSDLAAAIERIAKNEGDIKTINTTLTTIQGDESVEGSVKNLIKAAKDALDQRITNVDTKVGSLENLSTTDKDNIVDAINEVLAAVGTGGTASVVTLSESSSEDYAKVYTLKQGTTTVGTINIPKDMVVSSGTVEVNPAGQPAGTYIVLTLANATNDKLYINVGNLVDIYKAKAEAAQVQVAIDSETREISASIVAGSIGTTELTDLAVTTAKIAEGNVTKSKLSAEVQTSLGLADNAVQSVAAGTTNGTISVDGTEVSVAGLKSAAFAEASAFDAAGTAETKANAALASAKSYADELNIAMDGRVDVLEAAIGENGSVATQIATEIQKLDADITSAAVEEGKGIQVNVKEVDGKITEVAVSGDFSQAYDAAGSANSALASAKSYADGLAGNYATAAQGTKADSALQAADITTGSVNGTIAVKGTDVEVKGLGSAAYAATTAFDASGSAATAKSEAIAAAATDATTKANTAEANAKTYVDTALTWGSISE